MVLNRFALKFMTSLNLEMILADNYEMNILYLSVLSYDLLDHHIRFLKIDRSFIKDIPENNDDIAITSAMLAMADSLD